MPQNFPATTEEATAALVQSIPRSEDENPFGEEQLGW